MKSLLHYISLPVTIGVIFVIALNVFIYAGTERLLYEQDKKILEQRADYIQTQNNILVNRIMNEGMEEYTMSDFYGEEENVINALQSLASQIEGRVILLDFDFKVIADTYERNFNQYIITEDTLRVMGGEKVQPKPVGDSFVQAMTGIYDRENKECKGIIITLASLKEKNSFYSFIDDQRGTIQGLSLLISIVLAIVIALITRHGFQRMKKDLTSIFSGHQDGRMEEEGLKEFYDLSIKFNKIIDRYKDLEDSRQEFVSNVSHELKTPITSMKVLADSLLMQKNVPVEIYEEFMEDIVHEIDRENQIINDLLNLVRMDKTNAGLNVAPTNINELLEVLLKRITPIANERNITLHLETMRQVVAEVDSVKLSLACNNIIENAVKYNNDNGEVNVYLNADHKFFYIRVKDNGVGIPEDCQERIFERFYRVDKSHSRETGGTGLGLAITRSVVLMHKGSIRVHSKLGEETTFIMRIPLNYVG